MDRVTSTCVAGKLAIIMNAMMNDLPLSIAVRGIVYRLPRVNHIDRESGSGWDYIIRYDNQQQVYVDLRFANVGIPKI